jgi:uncharacterized protein (TIGR01777 family)
MGVPSGAAAGEHALTSILVAGGTGFIGGALVDSLLRDGHDITVLGRDEGRIHRRFGMNVRAVVWREPSDPVFLRDVTGHDIVFNLAGEKAVGRRYTAGSMQQIRDSRVKTTRRLVEALGSAAERPRLLISASAVGYYGARPASEPLEESDTCGAGFLAELCHEWESAALRAELRGIRVIIARLGVVLGCGGGAFEAMAKPFRLGFGGPIGNGKQPFSFISLSDCVRALSFCMEQPGLRGPINLSAPAPTNGNGIATALARVLDKPNWLPVPKLALRALYGEGAESLTTGQYVLPGVLNRLGFQFKHPTIDLAVAAAALAQSLKP